MNFYSSVKKSSISKLNKFTPIFKSNLGKRLLIGSTWSFLGVFIAKVSLFIAWIFVARILGTEEYGKFGIIRSTINVFISFAGFGLGLTATKFIAEFKELSVKKTSGIISMSIIVALIIGFSTSILLFFASDILASNFIKSSSLSLQIKLSSLIIFFASINGAVIGILSGYEAFKQIAKINLWTGLFSLPLIIIGTHYWGLNGTIITFMGNMAIHLLFGIIYTIKILKTQNIKINIKKGFKYWKILFTFSLPAVFSGLMVSPLKWISDTILVNSSDTGFQEMGIFVAAFTFQTIVLAVNSTLSKPLIPILSDRTILNNRKITSLNITVSWIVGILVGLPLILLPEIGEKLFGSNYEGYNFRLTLCLVMISTVFILFKDGLYRIMISRELMWLSFISNTFWGGSLLIIFFYLKNYGAVGLGFSYVISYIINTIFLIWIFQRKKLISKKVLYSPNAIAIWILLLTLIFPILLDVNIFLRFFLLIFYSTLFFYLFKKHLKVF